MPANQPSKDVTSNSGHRAIIKVNNWTMINPKAWNYGRTLVIVRSGDLENDMREAARWFQCAIIELKFEAEEITEQQAQALETDDE